MVPCSLSPSGPLHVGNGPMGTQKLKKEKNLNFCFCAIFSYDLSRFYFWALRVPLLVGPWGLRDLKKYIYSIFVLVPYFHVICLDFVFGLSACLYQLAHGAQAWAQAQAQVQAQGSPSPWTAPEAQTVQTKPSCNKGRTKSLIKTRAYQAVLKGMSISKQ